MSEIIASASANDCAPIGITIKCDAEVEASIRFSNPFGDRFRMQRAAAAINVLAIGSGVSEGRLHPARPKKFGSFGGGSTVRAIDQDAQAAQIVLHCFA